MNVNESHLSTISIDKKKIPKHIAIIMDGNGRWAKQKQKKRTVGHQAGVSALREVVKECIKLKIKHLSVYAFSTENWKRPKTEVSFLMKLLSVMIKKEINNLIKQNIQVNIIGEKESLPKELLSNYELIESKTKAGSTLQLNLMINYGSRKEIINGIKKAMQDPSITAENLCEKSFSDLLYTKNTPDPEILIRTSGEQRISNYLLWQISYSELYFTKTLWPDFSPNHLREIISDYQQRDRRFGGL